MIEVTREQYNSWYENNLDDLQRPPKFNAKEDSIEYRMLDKNGKSGGVVAMLKLQPDNTVRYYLNS